MKETAPLLKFSIVTFVLILAMSLLVTYYPLNHWTPNYFTKEKYSPDKFIAFTPYGRLSNRYFEIKTVIHLAYHLNRTIVLVPYRGLEMDEMFDFARIIEKFNRINLIITWRKYQQMHNMIPCLCLEKTYYSHPDDRFTMCNKASHNGTCTGHSVSPILGKQRLPLQDIESALAIKDSFMLVSGRWIWEARYIRGFSEILTLHKAQSFDFHLNYTESIWKDARRIYDWLISKSNSSNKTTLSIHIRLGDLSGRNNLTFLVYKAKEFSRKHSVPESLIFIATDANSTQLEMIRRNFPLAQIECPVEVVDACKHPVRRLLIIQALSSLTTHFLGSAGSSFTIVINMMRSYSKNKLT